MKKTEITHSGCGGVLEQVAAKLVRNCYIGLALVNCPSDTWELLTRFKDMNIALNTQLGSDMNKDIKFLHL